jgi:exopolysaccharide biosynthesis polyprenyl glycosylphosphotransferase
MTELKPAGLGAWDLADDTLGLTLEEPPARPDPALTLVSPVVPVRPGRGLSWVDGGLLVGVDALGLTVAVVAGALLGTRLAASSGPWWARFTFVPVLLVALSMYGLYRDRRRRIAPSGFHDLSAVGHAVLVGGLACWVGNALVLKSWWGVAVSPLEAVVAGSLALVLVPVGRAVAASGARRSGSGTARVLVVGSGQVADAVVSRLRRVGDVEVVGMVDDDPIAGSPVVGGLADLPSLCERLWVDRVVVAFSRTPSHETAEMLRSLSGLVPISVVPRFFELVSWRSQVEELHGLPVIDVAPPRLGMLAAIGKRSFDLTVSALGLLVLAPVMAAMAVAVKLTSPGPVYYRQMRMGRGGMPFAIYKFRTMVDGAEAQQAKLLAASDTAGLFKMRDDPRVTTLGRLMRKTSLDELPQLINVLVGHMSLVGPRPFSLPESSEIDGWAARRFEVRPGMTGLWQVSGRSELSWQDLRRLDYIYVASWSFWWDLKILWQTPAIVARSQGAY